MDKLSSSVKYNKLDGSAKLVSHSLLDNDSEKAQEEGEVLKKSIVLQTSQLIKNLESPAEYVLHSTIKWLIGYFITWKGNKLWGMPPMASASDIILSSVGAGAAILILGLLDHYLLHNYDLYSLAAPWGATALLLCLTPASPYVQPRALFMGNIICAIIGVSMHKLLSLALNMETYLWLPAGLSVGLSVTAMHLTKSMHPPAGATALYAVMFLRGWGLLITVLIATGLLFVFGVVYNNMQYRSLQDGKKAVYPDFWL